MVRAEYEESRRENRLKRYAAVGGAVLCGLGGAALLLTPGFHALGITSLVGAGALGKGSKSCGDQTIRHYKCPACGKDWEKKVES